MDSGDATAVREHQLLDRTAKMKKLLKPRVTEETSPKTPTYDNNSHRHQPDLTVGVYEPVVDWKWDNVPLVVFNQMQNKQAVGKGKDQVFRQETLAENKKCQEVKLKPQEVNMLNNYLTQVEMVVKYANRCKRLEALLREVIPKVRNVQDENKRLKNTLKTLAEWGHSAAETERKNNDVKLKEVKLEISVLQTKLREAEIEVERNVNKYNEYASSDDVRRGAIKKHFVITLNALIQRIQQRENNADTLKYVIDDLKRIVVEIMQSTEQNQGRKGMKKTFRNKAR